MTLSDEADHGLNDLVSYAMGECPVVPESEAEEAVMELEGTEEEPSVIDDPEWRARQFADDFREEAEDAVGPYAEDPTVAETAARELANRAHECMLDGLRGSPRVEIPDDA